MKNKAAIVTVFGAMSSKPYSHTSGYARILSAQLSEAGIDHDVLWTDRHKDVDWNNYRVVYVFHGLDMNGKLGLNLFGGACGSNMERLHKFARFNGQAFPLHYDWPAYKDLGSRGWPEPMGWVWPKIAKHTESTPFRHEHADVTCGDSHSMSVWPGMGECHVHSGQTMHGFNTSNLEIAFPELCQHRRRVTLLFGQIDVRHHLMRQPDPSGAAHKMVAQYIDLVATRARIHRWKEVELCTLHPIEDESRDIPTPGHFKGKPFRGTARQRDELRVMINFQLIEAAKHHGFAVHQYPTEWYGDDGLMNQEFMERPRSVHIAPIHYRSATTIFDRGNHF